MPTKFLSSFSPISSLILSPFFLKIKIYSATLNISSVSWVFSILNRIILLSSRYTQWGSFCLRFGGWWLSVLHMVDVNPINRYEAAISKQPSPSTTLNFLHFLYIACILEEEWIENVRKFWRFVLVDMLKRSEMEEIKFHWSYGGSKFSSSPFHCCSLFHLRWQELASFCCCGDTMQWVSDMVVCMVYMYLEVLVCVLRVSFSCGWLN